MKVGFIGLGTMGRYMATDLARAGHELTVHDLRREAGRARFQELDACAAPLSAHPELGLAN